MHKKQHERFLLEQFLDAADLHAEIVEEREAPDFLIRYEGRLISVEVTELYITDSQNLGPLQAQESISARIAARAHALYRESGAPPAHVSVCFGPACDLRGLNRERTAILLSSFVQGLNLAAWQRVDWRPDALNGPLPFEISFLHALGVPSHDMAHWSVPRAGWVVPLAASSLYPRIAEKAKRLPSYRAITGENWLLVVADRTKPSQLFDLGKNLNARAITSPFTRTFYYGYPEKPIIELGV